MEHQINHTARPGVTWVTARQAAEMLGVSDRNVYKFVDTGELRLVTEPREGRRREVKIAMSDVEALVQKRQQIAERREREKREAEERRAARVLKAAQQTIEQAKRPDVTAAVVAELKRQSDVLDKIEQHLGRLASALS